MLSTVFLRISPSVKRQILTVYLSEVVSESLVIDAFKEQYPQGVCFSDNEALLNRDDFETLKATRAYLGTTTPAILLDIRTGFPLDYFLAIAATIDAGGILCLLSDETPFVNESLRFHHEAIETPFFNQYLDELLRRFSYVYKDSVLYLPTDNGYIEDTESNDFFSRIDMGITNSQKVIYDDFLRKDAGVYTLFSERGTGKSWLGAALIDAMPENYILTAPNQGAVTQYQYIEGLRFRAPDLLFLSIPEEVVQDETLIIEEAAKMPLAHLERLCKRFKKVLMISSVSNYEGTGQGLREKIHDLVCIKKSYQLIDIQRYLEGDPLKQLCDALMFMDTRDDSGEKWMIDLEAFKHKDLLSEIQCHYYDDENIEALRGNIDQLKSLYHLLNETHYQTSIQDIRRLFDAPGQVFILAYLKGKLIGAIWGIEEGGLSQELTEAVFQGTRRPKGNLVAQMLTGQSYFPEAMSQLSVRISRISVDQSYRFCGIGRQMEILLENRLSGIKDFISVSFGLTKGLLQFWEALGYRLAHLGFHLDKTTGLYSAVVLKSLSEKSVDWIRESFDKFGADAYFLRENSYKPDILEILADKAHSQDFDDRDKRVIEAVDHYKRGKHTIKNALSRIKK